MITLSLVELSKEVDRIKRRLCCGSSAFKTYVANITQVDSLAPTDEVIVNTLGGDITWQYNSNGIYQGTLTGGFPAGKFWSMPSTLDGAYFSRVVVSRVDDNTILLLSEDGDNHLANTSIEIRVYP